MGILAAKANDQIVVTKSVGLSGTVAIVKECYEHLHERYTSDFLEKAIEYENQTGYDLEYEVLDKHGYNALVEASYGGIFGALFQLGYDSDLGFLADLTKLPIKQQTIEISENYHLNPYMLHSMGAMVIAVADGERLVWELKSAGVDAVIVGHMTKEKGRIVYLEEECRYLVPPRTDELFKCLTDRTYRTRFPKNIVEK